MFCSACGTQLAPGLSYCNRCGMSLKEPSSKLGPITAFLVAITLLGTVGLGIMLGGAAALTNGAHLKEELVGFFMLFTFLIIGMSELLLIRQLSRLISYNQTKQADVAPPTFSPIESRQFPLPRVTAEPLPSVTENTTRTLNYSRNQPQS